MTDRSVRMPKGLDAGIAETVRVLIEGGVETFESCEGGDGHAYPEPTVRFFGERAAGFRALAVALENGLNPIHLRRVWPIVGGEPTGPWWEIVFPPTMGVSRVTATERRGERNART